MIGTAHYMSPEQATGNQATSASDIYSLGVIAYEMFAGRRPFDADTPLGISSAHVHSPVPALPAGVPRGVAELIREALAKDPASRPASAADFAVRARREMRDDRPAPTLTMPAATTVTAMSAQPSPARAGDAGGDGVAPVRETGRPGLTALLVFLTVLVLIAGGAWLFTTVSGNDVSTGDSLSPDSTATTEPSTSTTVAAAAPADTRHRRPTARSDHGCSDDGCSDDGTRGDHRSRNDDPASRDDGGAGTVRDRGAPDRRSHHWPTDHWRARTDADSRSGTDRRGRGAGLRAQLLRAGQRR